jgi:hypothetical protein
MKSNALEEVPIANGYLFFITASTMPRARELRANSETSIF